MPNSKEVIWNGVSSSSIPELTIGKVHRQLIGADRNIHKEIAGRPGTVVFPERPGLREVTMECFVQATSFVPGRRDAITAVADWLDFFGEAALLISDEPDVYYEAVLADPPDPDEWRDVGTFLIRFYVQPYSLEIVSSNHLVNGDDNFTNIFDPGLLAPTYPVIELTPTAGNLESFELTMNGSVLRWEGFLDEDETMNINSISAVALTGVSDDSMLTGGYDPSDLSMEGVSGEFPELLPGSNQMDFVRTAGTATAVTINIKYRRRFRK